MELTNTLKKGIILDTFNILSATAALVLSLIVYAMHDYFNLFGVKHAIVFTILIFYGLAATGYYFLCFKESNSYKMPTVGTRIISLLFYTSIGIAVFFAYKIYINSPLDYIIAFFAGCILGALIKDVTAFAVYANKSDDRTFDLLDITFNLMLLSLAYLNYNYKIDNVELSLIGTSLVVTCIIHTCYLAVKSNMSGKSQKIDEFFIILASIANSIFFPIINFIFLSMYKNLEISMIVMAVYLYLSNGFMNKIIYGK
jgi:hypothetical protein